MSAAGEIVVVGAGPAGALAARELARRGARVRLLDKARFPRSKVCGCCLNPAALAALAAVGLGELPARLGAVPLARVALAAGRHRAEVRLGGSVALSREAFDAALVDEAVAAGATFEPGTTWRGERGAGPQALTIFATGLSGDSGTAAPASRIGAGVVVPAAAAPEFYSPGTIFMATDRGGYVGLVRLEDGRLDIAAALDAAFVRSIGGLGAAAAAILSAAAWPLPERLGNLPWKGTPALTRTPRAVAGPGWFAVGDAAGYVEPFTGEGMAWALASAAVLAPIALRAVAHGVPPAIREWTAAHRRIVGRRQRLCRAFAWGLRSPQLAQFAVRLLAVVPPLARPFLAALHRPPHWPHGTPR